MAEGAPVGRRVVFGIVTLGAVGVVFGDPLQHGLDRITAPLRNGDPIGLTDLVPAAGGFRYYSVASSVTDLTRGGYKLTVGGLVERPMELTLDDLKRMPQTEMVRDFQCVTGWRVEEVHWSGVR